ncbi:DUF6879 family protein [Actinomadura rudentiformis]|uniref:DUF6879 domain-containing protein n=1 Tax=Actinomadura rudentiformis TaxID=359158 RepID=A0A6H9YPZ3_9ACTN|nr:DUF6879 family protein [Actinomadura rudentiformis]KAB2344911.1 hypothetical protein F8566_30440 [Actinomadura rudentiformis]
MELISVQRRSELIAGARTSLKLELRDNYAADAESLAAWRRGGAAEARKLVQPYADQLAPKISAGEKVLRRVKILSEPPSEYMRHALDVAGALVDAGEDIRWLPRRLASTLLLPGNDFFILDSQLVIFNVLDGEDSRAEQQLYTAPDVVDRCQAAFDAAWELAVPHHDYR